ncbi:hypothetical protein GC177_00655 [bacterium]|nr:hypothetical protein [bacterium]
MPENDWQNNVHIYSYPDVAAFQADVRAYDRTGPTSTSLLSREVPFPQNAQPPFSSDTQGMIDALGYTLNEFATLEGREGFNGPNLLGNALDMADAQGIDGIAIVLVPGLAETNIPNMQGGFGYYYAPYGYPAQRAIYVDPNYLDELVTFVQTSQSQYEGSGLDLSHMSLPRVLSMGLSYLGGYDTMYNYEEALGVIPAQHPDVDAHPAQTAMRRSLEESNQYVAYFGEPPRAIDYDAPEGQPGLEWLDDFITSGAYCFEDTSGPLTSGKTYNSHADDIAPFTLPLLDEGEVAAAPHDLPVPQTLRVGAENNAHDVLDGTCGAVMSSLSLLTR